MKLYVTCELTGEMSVVFTFKLRNKRIFSKLWPFKLMIYKFTEKLTSAFFWQVTYHVKLRKLSHVIL